MRYDVKMVIEIINIMRQEPETIPKYWKLIQNKENVINVMMEINFVVHCNASGSDRRAQHYILR